jgi:hypothetical protein
MHCFHCKSSESKTVKGIKFFKDFQSPELSRLLKVILFADVLRNYNIKPFPSQEDRDKMSTRERNELISALSLVIIFLAALMGKEMGNLYASFEEMESLEVYFDVPEEELADYLIGVLNGQDVDLDVGLTITLPQESNMGRIVTETPDYVRRWLISLTLSAVTVRQPSVSDVEISLYVEGQPFINEVFEFNKEKVSYLGLIDREIELKINDLERFKSELQNAAKLYGGEVEVGFNGRVQTHLLWLNTWLPFSTTQYPLVSIPELDYKSSEWKNIEGGKIDSVEVGQDVFVSIHVGNPMRVHSFYENVTCTIYKENEITPVSKKWKEISVAPTSSADYVFPFILNESGKYSYRIESNTKVYVKSEDSMLLTVAG